MWSNWDKYLVDLAIIGFMILLVIIKCESIDKKLGKICEQVDDIAKSITIEIRRGCKPSP